jgi:hypothetical protein
LPYYNRERWIWGGFIVSHAARMASNAGNDENILLFGAREYSIIVFILLNICHFKLYFVGMSSISRASARAALPTMKYTG